MPSRGGQQGSFVSPYQVSLRYAPSSGSAFGPSAADWFGPLAPMDPIAPDDVAGRQWDFPVGFNLSVGPRIAESIGFPALRELADAYDLLRIVIETRKDQVARIGWRVKPRHDAGARAGPDDPRIAPITQFLRRPDGARSFSDWLRVLLEDLFVVDAPTLYLQRDRAGRLLSLVPLDGATIKPVIDAWGRRPQPYEDNGALVYPVAYQQILKGVPAVDYTARDLLYRPRNMRAHRAYGFSPVEQIVTTVNIALRRQLFTLEYFASGNIPDSLIGVPDAWTPDQIASYQKYWDAYIEGDLGRRRKAKFVPGGVAKTFIQTKEPELKGEFDEWLARIVCFAFSVSPQALIRPMNRASGETQKQLAEEEGLRPVLDWAKALLDEIIETEFDAPDLEFVFAPDQPVDPAQQAIVIATYVQAGVLTINEARAQLGLPPMGNPLPHRGGGGERSEPEGGANPSSCRRTGI